MVLWWISNVWPGEGYDGVDQVDHLSPLMVQPTHFTSEWTETQEEKWHFQEADLSNSDRTGLNILISLLLSSWAHSFIYSFNRYVLGVYFVTDVLIFQHLAFNAAVGLATHLLQGINVFG